MSGDRIRYGVIGMGRQGDRYIRHIRLDTNHADLVAVTRSDSRKGVKLFFAHTLRYSYVGGRNGRVELIGPKGMLLGDHVRNTLEFLDQKGSRPIKVGEPALTVIHMLRDATRAFRGKQSLTASPPWLSHRHATDQLKAKNVKRSCIKA